MATTARLDTLRVAELMTRDVVTIGPEASASELARELSAHGISGVPVVDEADRVLGVASASDLLRMALLHDEVGVGDPALYEPTAEGADPGSAAYFAGGDAEVMRVLSATPATLLGTYTVEDVMTPATFSIAPDATVRELARFLARGRIHRVLVLEEGRLAGLVTASDVVRAVAESTD